LQGACFRLPGGGVFDLSAVRIGFLAEIALAAAQAAGHPRQAEVRRRPQRVTSEHSQSPCIGWNIALQRNFHGEVRDPPDMEELVQHCLTGRRLVTAAQVACASMTMRTSCATECAPSFSMTCARWIS